MKDGPCLFADLLPAGAVAADIQDDGQEIFLRPGEMAAVRSAGVRRRRDFTLGRHCAHRALGNLGMTVAALPMTQSGAPLWPEGVIGSITHTHGYAAAIAAPRHLWRGIGLDAERLGAVKEALFPKLFGAEECRMLHELSAEQRSSTATAMFSAKEAHYKACGTAGPICFGDLQVTLAGNRIFVRRGDGSESSQGSYAVAAGLVLAVLSIPA